MTLSIVHTESSTGWGGQEIRILTEMAGMRARGHRVMLLTPEDAQIHAAAVHRGLPVEAIDVGRKNYAGFHAIRAWLSRNRSGVDVINTHSSTDSWLAALACASGTHAPPIVRTRHLSTRVNRSPATRWLYQRATRHIVVTGEALRTQLIRDNGYDPARITSVRTGIDLHQFRPLDKAAMRSRLAVDPRPALGIVATLRDWKGHDDLLDAWDTLARRGLDWQLLIIGDGPQRARLEGRVQAMRLTGSVRFVGNQDDVPAWLACLELVALPSFGEEGVPQSLMQAAACGVPAVATPIGAIAEAVIDGRTGLLVPPRNPTALADALDRMMRNAQLRAAMGEAAHAYAQENFGIDGMLDAMEQIFARAAAWKH